MTQPGWYDAPSEPGMLRYWSGDAWTDHRQPAPTAQAPVALAPAALAPAALAPAALEPVEHTSGPGHWLSADTGFGTGFAVDGIRVGPGALSQLSEFSTVASGLEGAMNQARANAQSQPRSTALKGAVKGMVTGLVIIVLGAALILFFSAQNTVGPGEVAIQGTVASHSGFGSACTPVVDFQVGGQTYRATEGVGGSCSSDFIGESVDVIYSAANPSLSGRFHFGNPVESFDLLVPVLGIVIFVSSLAMFLVRLFRRRSQFAQQ